MSNRTLIELNHDFCPSNDDAEVLKWAHKMRLYIISGDKNHLPNGVTFFWRRHHSDPCPFEQPLEFERRTERLKAATERSKRGDRQ